MSWSLLVAQNPQMFTVYTMYTQLRESRMFIDVSLNCRKMQALLDTGNMSNIDLLDYNIYLRSYLPDKRPPLRQVKTPIRTAGSHNLSGIGVSKVELEIGKLGQNWETSVYVFRNIGVPAILSANSMTRMNMKIDMAKAVEYVGPYGHMLTMKKLNDTHRKTFPLRYNYYVDEGECVNLSQETVAQDTTVKPKCVAVANVRLDYSGARDVYFQADNTQGSLQRSKLTTFDLLDRVRQDEHWKEKSRANFFFIPLVNNSPEKRRLRAGRRSDQFIYYR